MLTIREIQILKLIAEGYKAHVIATKLFISYETVISHKKHIIEKLDCKNTPNMIYQAMKQGIIK